MECIAHTKANGCKRLTVERCVGSDNCPFYQTEEQAKASHEKANSRLTGLDSKLQIYISDKYYNGGTPWLKEDETYGR